MTARPTGRRSLATASAVLIGLAGAGCAGSGPNDDDGAASCARLVEFDSRTYADVLDEATSAVRFTIGAKLGTARELTCADTGTEATGKYGTWSPAAYAIDGLDSTVAIAIGDTPQSVELFAVDQEGKALPERVRKFLDATPAASPPSR